MYTNNITPNFTYEEIYRSEYAARHAIDNESRDLPTLYTLYQCAWRMEMIRSVLGDKGIHPSSWYRCPKLNEAIGGSEKSQHMRGEAVDFICPNFGPPREIVSFLHAKRHRVQYDQLILEHTWVHISFALIPPCTPRKQTLILQPDKTYIPWEK